MIDLPNRTRPPELVLPDHHFSAMYEAAWVAAQRNLIRRSEGDLLSCMPGSSTSWLWDSCFMVMYARYSNGWLPVQRSLDQFYEFQRSDGYIGMAYDVDTGELAYGERINPPLLAWAEWSLFEITGDTARLASVLDPLIRFYDWIDANRRRSSGLYWFEDSGSSGMDNAPRGGYIAPDLTGSDICFVDLLAQQALSAVCIARIADQLGRSAIRDRFERHHSALVKLADTYHWSDRAGFYFDVFARSDKDDRHNFVNHQTVASFWTLEAGVAQSKNVSQLVEHLTDPESFGTSHRVPSLAASDPNFDPEGGYWLGGVWSPTTYMVCAGLKSVGESALAFTIAKEHLNAVADVFGDSRYGGFWECYAPEGQRPGTSVAGRMSRENFVGWTGLSPIAMMIEFVLGLSFHASTKHVIWTPHLEGEQGLRNLCFGDDTISIVADWSSIEGRYSATVTSDRGLTLEVRVDGQTDRFPLPAGSHKVVSESPDAKSVP